jgi:hypothetical protein
VSYNTANNNGDDGITAGGDDGGDHTLDTGNIAMNNVDQDFDIACPSTVTNNDSNGGTYNFVGNGCHTSNNQ